ncbi:MAG: DUF4342 domain-containing protein [Cyanobacteria bacterium J06638_6]
MSVHSEAKTQTVDVVAPEIVALESEDSTDDSSEETLRDRVTVEEIKISGDALVAKIKELVHQSNIRRIIIKNDSGHTLIEIPLTVGVIGGAVGAAFFPVVAALGVIGAMVAHLTVVVERQVSPEADDSDAT